MYRLSSTIKILPFEGNDKRKKEKKRKRNEKYIYIHIKKKEKAKENTRAKKKGERMRKDYISSRRIINRQLTVNIKRREIYQSPHDDISIPVTTSCLHKHTLVSRRLLDLGTISRAYYIIRLFKKKERKKRREIERTFPAFPYSLWCCVSNANRSKTRIERCRDTRSEFLRIVPIARWTEVVT